jgi:hypothetical protein
MKLTKVAAAAAVGLTVSFGAATAAPVVGSISFEATTVTGGPLVSGAVLNLSGVSYRLPGSDDFLSLVGGAISNFSVTLTAGTSVAFSGLGGDFSGLVTSVIFSGGSAFANVTSTDGTFTPDPLFIPFAGMSANPETTVRLSFTTIGVGLGGSGVMEAAAPTTPDAVPEPLSLGLFGLGLAGLGVAMRRRPKAAPTA